jgi:metal-responsive CopG/Arc/MetJ family transcriptional regulator
MPVQRVAVSLPTELYRQIEEARRFTGQTRSQLMADAAAEYLAARRAEAEAHAYRRGYELHPETAEEIAKFHGLSSEVLASVPWDEAANDDQR